MTSRYRHPLGNEGEDSLIEEGWTDIVISNSVINLCADKRRVFAGITRVLRPAGRGFVDIEIGPPLVAKARGL